LPVATSNTEITASPWATAIVLPSGASAWALTPSASKRRVSVNVRASHIDMPSPSR
jgi:hypothetical protein